MVSKTRLLRRTRSPLRQIQRLPQSNKRQPPPRRGRDNEYTEPNTPRTPLGDIATLKVTSTGDWPDITSPAKRTKEYTGEYAESNTTKTPVSDTPVGSSEHAESHTTNEENKQNPTSPATPPGLTHGFQNQAAGPQVQAAATNEIAHSAEPGTSSRPQAHAFPESQEHTKRKRGSDETSTHSTNLSLDTIIARPTKRNKKFTGEYAKPSSAATPHRHSLAGGRARDVVPLIDPPKSTRHQKVYTSRK